MLAGGSGHLGTLLAEARITAGDEVVVLTRAPQPARWRSVAWDGATVGAWADELDGADVLVNLAGRSVNCRYTEANRRAIMESRVQSTRALGAALRAVARPPAVWLQSSTATIYAHRYDAPNDEASGIIGGSEPDAPAKWRFSIDVAQAWEREAERGSPPATRLVKLRTAIVMTRDPGGPFAILRGLARRGLGGPSGNGRQYVSWIHATDFVRALDWIVRHEEFRGAVNVAAPHPLPNAEFMRELRAACGVPIGLPSPSWMLELGAVVLRTETELMLKSRRVVPAKLLAGGFRFAFPTWESAARDLCTAG